MADAESPVSRSRGDLISTILMMAAALAAVAGFGVLFSLWWRTDVSENYEVLRIASQEYIDGRPIVAGELAEQVTFAEDLAENGDEGVQSAVDVEVAPEDVEVRGEAAREAREQRLEWIRLRDFLVGVGKVARGNEEEDSRERRRLFDEAISYLEAAKKNGFPPGRFAEGYRVLGETLFNLGRYDESIGALSEAISRDPTMRRNLLPVLAEAQLNSLAPIADQALATITEFLSDRSLQPQERWRGQLTRIRALIDLKRWQEANDLVAQLLPLSSTDASQALEGPETDFRDELALLESVLRIKRAIDRYGDRPADQFDDRSAAIDELAGTLQDLSDLQRKATPRIASQARLWAARAMLVQGFVEDALNQLTAVRQQRPFGAEAIIAGLEEIEFLANQGRGLEMLLSTRYMMRELGDSRGFDASLITFEEFRRRLSDAIDVLRRKGEFEYAIDTSRSLPPVFDVSEALTHEGIGYREWASATIADGTNINGQVARNALALARARFRAAGDALAEAARLQFDTEEYLATLWSAIDAYQRGRHFSQSIRLLEPYLQYEERRRQPRGLVALGRALLAEDQPDRAIDALTTCIVEFPRDPLRYDARLLAALAYAENGDFDNARTLLRDNLEDGELTPQNPTWRDSLLTLGELLYERGYRNFLLAEQSDGQQKIDMLRDNQPILTAAIRRLDEAVARYWMKTPRAENAQYLSARAHVMSSRWPRIESQSPGILDTARRTLRTQADQQLNNALNGFVKLRKHLATREEEQRLAEAQQSMLRNCFLAEADVLRELNRLEDASSAYRVVELRYMNEPPVLEALLGRANCAKELGKPTEADLLVQQAAVILQRIPAEWDGRFAETTRYDRQGWEDYLSWMNQRIGGV